MNRNDNSKENSNKNDKAIESSFVVNAGDTPSIQVAPYIQRPAPKVKGRLFLDTDHGILYRDTGKLWKPIQLGPRGPRGFTGPQGFAGPPGPPGPSAPFIPPSVNRIYITNVSSNNVSVIDGVTNTVSATITVGTTPRGVDVNPVTNRIYVANNISNDVSVINGTTNTVIATISVGLAPQGVSVNSTTNRIYVANSTSCDVPFPQ